MLQRKVAALNSSDGQ